MSDHLGTVLTTHKRVRLSVQSPSPVCHGEVGFKCKHCEIIFHSFLNSIDYKVSTDTPVVEISTVYFLFSAKI